MTNIDATMPASPTQARTGRMESGIRMKTGARHANSAPTPNSQMRVKDEK